MKLRVVLMLMAATIAAGLTVAIQAGAQESGDITTVAGAPKPPGFDPQLVPFVDGNGIEQFAEAAERERDRVRSERARLASPNAKREREESSTKYDRLSDQQALALLDRTFASDIASMTSMGAVSDVAERPGVKFLDDYTAVLPADRTSGPRLVESSEPLRATDGDGTKAPVNMSLKASEDGFAPKNSLADVTLPNDLDDPLQVGEILVSIDGDAGAIVRRDEQVAYPNAKPDTDVLLVPTASGAEVFWQLRSPAAPTTLPLDLDIPADATLQPRSDGSVLVLRGDEVIASVHPPAALDAQGRAVPVSTEVHDGTLAMTIDHRAGNFAFPILLDPVIEDWWGGGSNSWYQQGSFALDGLNYWSNTYAGVPANTYAPRTTCYTPVSCYLPPTGNPNTPDGLHMYVRSWTTYPGWTNGFWFYQPSGTTTRIARVDYKQKYLRMRGGPGYPYMFTGIYRPNTAEWDAISTFASDLSNHSNTQYGANTPAPHWATFGFASLGTVTTGNDWRDAYMGGVVIELTDPELPTITNHNAVGFGPEWRDSGTFSVSSTATDPGLGIRSFSLEVSDGAITYTQIRDYPCSGRRKLPCPATWSIPQGTTTGFSFSVADGNPASPGNQPLPEGINNVVLRAHDPLGQAGKVTLPAVKVDRTPPTSALSGALMEALQTPASYPDGSVVVQPDGTHILKANQYGLRVVATDGSEGAPRSGVKSIEFLVDGVQEDYTEQACPLGSCPLEFDWVFDTAAYPAGQHTLTVKVTDQVGRQTITNRLFQTSSEVGQCAGNLPYQAYWLGEEFAGMPLASQTRHCEAATDILHGLKAVVTTYGECDNGVAGPTEPHGCSLPLQVISTRICDAQVGVYQQLDPAFEPPNNEASVPTAPLDYDATTIRSTDAAVLESGTIIDIYTGNTTVQIVGDDPALVEEAAAAVEAATQYGGDPSSPGQELMSPNGVDPYSGEGC